MWEELVCNLIDYLCIQSNIKTLEPEDVDLNWLTIKKKLGIKNLGETKCQ